MGARVDTAKTVESVSSADGTTIAFQRTGHGPAVVLVSGALWDRHSTESLAAELAPSFTVYEYDRRGRGDSGDTGPYAIERELEDLAAVLAVTGDQPFVFGHSSGAILGLEAAARRLPLAKLAAYEPPFIVDDQRVRPPADLGDRLADLVGAGRRDDAVKLFLTEAVQLSPETLGAVERGPAWPAMTAVAHTLPYDVALSNHSELPADRVASITVPTLVLGGGNSPGWFQATVATVAATIPGAEHRFLDGQDHGAAPEVLAPVLVEFFDRR